MNLRLPAHRASAGLAALVMCGSAVAAGPTAPPVDFVRDIQPIFRAHCLSCHGPEKQKNGFRVDVREVFFKGGDTHGVAVVPGRSAESPLLNYVNELVPDMRMPPKGEPLAPVQIGLLRRWIDSGAPWPDSATVKLADKADWWSLKPLARPSVPRTDKSGFAIRNPVDAFVAARLRENGLPQSPEADARTLARRLYFDLTGLPPTAQEVEAFVADRSPDAYEKLVDRLLASPRHGERWARHWLDVVHYGDTHGYDKDRLRTNAWPYRDYVIRAFNEDKPYTRFIQEQIAGDVLFPGTRDGIEALGFLSAGPWDAIGHMEVPETKIDGKIARHNDRDDVVQNTILSFNSLTVGCAQCHDHKFDPITQEDYYSLQAVFAALDRTEVAYFTDDSIARRQAKLNAGRQRISAKIASAEAPLRRQAGEKFAALNRRILGVSERAPKQGANARPDYGYHSAISATRDEAKWVQVDLGRRMTIERVVLRPCYDDFNGIGAGFGFPVRFKVEASDDPEFKTGVTLLWRKHDVTFMNDFQNPGLRPFETGGARDDGVMGRHVRVTASRLAPRKGDFIFALAELEVFDPHGTNLAKGRPVTALDSIEAPPRWRKANLTDGIAPEPHSREDRDRLIEERDALLLSFADDATRAKLDGLRRELKRVDDELAALPAPSRVYAGAVHTGNGSFRGTGPDGGRPRAIHILHRGDVKQPRAEAGPGALSAIAGLPARFELAAGHAEGERRAALAKWLADPRHPLTWRSIVNRVWHYHFGRGIVETPNDFGRNGASPTHPELLDWLACEFRDGGGSLKRLHKLILTSATYRQSSSVGRPAAPAKGDFGREARSRSSFPDYSHAIATDADNRFLWRQNRRKLDAESVRDSVLFVSGRLDERMGGPGFRDFVLEKAEHSPHYQYHLHDPDDPKSHRRSVYRFIVRSQLQPFMTTLDCADPSMQVDRRNESVSPLQALALLNNGLMVATSRHFADRLEADGGDLAAKVTRGFSGALGRPPTDGERTALTAMAHEHGLANLCRLLFNLNEFNFVD